MDTHEIPEVINPVGNVCYPLFIPDDPHWRQLVLGALSQLANPEYYRQNAFTPNDVISVCDLWHERTLVPLVQSMNDNLGCGMTPIRIEARRLTTQAIVGNTDTAIVWDAGDYDTTNPTRLIFPVSGIAIVSVNFRLLASGNTVPLFWLRKDGQSQTDTAFERADASIQTHYFNETWTFDVVAGQYLEAFINSGVAGATLQSSAPTPRFAALVV